MTIDFISIFAAQAANKTNDVKKAVIKFDNAVASSKAQVGATDSVNLKDGIANVSVSTDAPDVSLPAVQDRMKELFASGDFELIVAVESAEEDQA